MNMKKIFVIAFCALSTLFCWAQKASVTTTESGKVNVTVTANAAGGLQALVDTALAQYNTANGTSFGTADIESLKVGGSLVAFNADLTKGTLCSIIDLITGDTGDDASYIWSKMRKTLKHLDLSAATIYAHFAVKSAAGDTVKLDLPINVLPPKTFWRGIDIDTELAPTASEKLKNGMTALEEVKLPSSLMGFSRNTIKLIGTMLKGFISDNAIAETVIKYITEDNADAFCGIGDYAFAHATSLKSVTIPYNMLAPVSGIGEKAFYNDASLTSVTFEKSKSFLTKGKCGITTIGKNAFAYSGITEVNLPKETDSIAQGAFMGCSSLASVNFEGSNAVRHIGAYAFMGTAISGIKIPAKVTLIGDEALRGCKTLSCVEILGTTDSLSMGEKVFYSTPSMNGGTFTCTRTIVPKAGELKKKGFLKGYDGTFAGLGGSKTSSNMLHGTLITNAEKPVNETDGSLLITIPEAMRKAYCEASGWSDLLTVPEPIRGDVNDDGKVDTSDASSLINNILGTANYGNDKCDVNVDSAIDVTDVTTLISIILDK